MTDVQLEYSLYTCDHFFLIKFITYKIKNKEREREREREREEKLKLPSSHRVPVADFLVRSSISIKVTGILSLLSIRKPLGLLSSNLFRNIVMKGTKEFSARYLTK